MNRMWIGSSGTGQTEERRSRHRPDLGRVAGEHEAHELPDVVVDAPPLAHRRHDRGEVVVEQHDVRRLARDVSAGPAHRDADVGLAERRRIVHPVTGHGHELALPLERRDDADLLGRIDARENPHAAQPVVQLIIAHTRQRRAGDDLCCVFGDAKPPGNGERRVRMVSGDHHRHDSRRLAGSHGALRFRTRRIDDADETEQFEIALHRLGAFANRRFGKAALGDRQHPQAPSGQCTRYRQRRGGPGSPPA
jgi:hypothetical protein